MMMNLRTIPKTDLHVSPLCLGTMTFGTPVAEDEAIRITHWALDHGINFIDTANMYEGYTRRIGSAGGVAETILGKALRDRREQAIVATKVGMKIGPTDDDEGSSRAHILREIDRSLKRLNCDYVDVYYLHRPYPSVPIAESIQAMNDLIAAGKVRYWAVSNFSAEQLSALLQVCDDNSWRRPVALQPAYSLLKRDIEQDLLPLCQRQHLAVIPYQVLQGGLLSGKYQRDLPTPTGSRHTEKPEWMPAFNAELFDQLDRLTAEAAVLNRTLYSHALLALLDQPAVASLIIGVKRISQLKDALRALI